MNTIFAEALFVATALVYLGASVLFIAFLAGWRGGANVVRTVAPRLVGLGAALHAVQIVVASLVLNVCPVEGIHFPMSVVAMLMCVAYLVVRVRYRVDVLGAFVAPLALTALLASQFVGNGRVRPTTHIRSVLIPFHVASNLFGVALFALACGAAALYLVQERLLKNKKVEGLFQRLPALDALDRAEHRFLVAGFPLLTFGILTGTVWARQIEAGGTADLLRAAFGYVTWLLVAGVLFLRAAAGWRGRRAAYGTIAGFGFALLVLVLYLVRSLDVPAAAATAPTASRVDATAAPADAYVLVKAKAEGRGEGRAP